MRVFRTGLAGVLVGTAVLLATPGTAQAAFTDVPPSHRFVHEIDWLAQQGISTGYANSNGSFRFEPSGPVLREQMAAFLYRYTGATATARTCGLSDVPASHRFAKEICWLKAQGITTGYAVPGGVQFRGGQPVLREQMAAFLARLAGAEASLTAPTSAPFRDVPTSHTFARQIAWLSTTAVTQGYAVPGGTEFRGGQPVLREQMAAFLMRYDATVGWTGKSSLELVSFASDNTVSGNSGSLYPVPSRDGRYVAFVSGSSNLVPGDTNGANDIFVRDTTSGSTSLVSRATGASGVIADGSSEYPDISDDGRYVVFASPASNLVPGDTNASFDVFRRDLNTGTIELVSKSATGVPGNSYSAYPSISADGRYVAFTSYSNNLVGPEDTGAFPGVDVYVRDMTTNAVTRISRAPGGSGSNGVSERPSISADGRFVAFSSTATNLIDGDTNARRDAFLWDRLGSGNRLTLVSSDPLGVGRDVESWNPAISDDGAFVTFYAYDFSTGTTPPRSEVVLWRRATGVSTIVSRAPGGAVANGSSFVASISADGRYVAYASDASNLVVGDTNGVMDSFVWDRLTATTTIVSRTPDRSTGRGKPERVVVGPTERRRAAHRVPDRRDERRPPGPDAGVRRLPLAPHRLRRRT